MGRLTIINGTDLNFFSFLCKNICGDCLVCHFIFKNDCTSFVLPFLWIRKIQHLIITLQFPTDVLNRVEVAASTVDSLKNLVFSLGKDSSAVDRQTWLMDSASLLQKIRDAADELVSCKYFLFCLQNHI